MSKRVMIRRTGMHLNGDRSVLVEDYIATKVRAADLLKP